MAVAKKKTSAKKAPVKKVAVKKSIDVSQEQSTPPVTDNPPQVNTPVKTAQPKVVNFFFPKAKGASFRWRTSDRSVVAVRAKNGMLRLDPSNAHDKYAIEQLKSNPKNRANGGNMFVEVSGNSTATGVSGEIDKLLEMDAGAIIAMLGGDLALHRLTKGGLIAKVLELD